MLLTGNGAFPPNFFCNKVADVIDAKAINDAMIPTKGKLLQDQNLEQSLPQ